MYKIVADLKNTEELDIIERKIEKHLTKFHEDFTIQILWNVQAKTPLATGLHYKSIKGYVELLGPPIWKSFIGSYLDTIKFVEYGRLPGGIPPISAIENWCIAVGINPDNAYQIAIAISQVGTMGKFMFMRGYGISKIQLDRKARQSFLQLYRELKDVVGT